MATLPWYPGSGLLAKWSSAGKLAAVPRHEVIEGIARGSAQPWQWIYAYNLLDEEWTWARDQKSGIAPGCTVAGFAPEGGTTLLAQTMDIPNIHDGTQAVLPLEPAGTAAEREPRRHASGRNPSPRPAHRFRFGSA